MNKRFFKDVITIYNQKSDDTFQRNVLKNVYVRKVRKSTINSKGEEVASSATIVIPTAFTTINDKLAINTYIDTKTLDKSSAILNFTLNVPLIYRAWTLMDGDYIVDKETTMEFDLRELKKQCKVYRVQSVADNRKGGLQHFKLEVVE